MDYRKSTKMIEVSETKKKEPISYKRDANGHLMCHICDFMPDATPKHPHGNPSTLHYHIKRHSGDCPYVCKACGHPFLHKLALETHIASRHPEANQKVEMFRCTEPGCEFESLTRGNLQIHKARKHYSSLVNQYLAPMEVDKKRVYHCKCCTNDYKSSTSFNHHILKCLDMHRPEAPDMHRPEAPINSTELVLG